MTYAGDAPPRELWAALTLEGKKVSVRGLRFLINGGRGVVPLAAVLLRGEDNSIQDCEFFQAQLSQDEKNRVASVVLQGSGSPRLTLSGCCFLGFRDLKERTLSDVEAGGQDALTVSGAANVVVEQCAFGPHDALCRVEGNSTVGLSHCTFLAGPRSAVFHVLDSGAKLNVETCLFSGPRRAMAGDQAVVVREERPRAAAYQGKDNRYCNLSAFEANPSGMSDARAVSLLPLEAPDNLHFNPSRRGQPLRRLASLSLPNQSDGSKTGADDAVFKAFQPDDRAADLRVVDQPERLVGVETFTAGSYLTGPSGGSRLPYLMAEKRHSLIVDPTRSEDKNNGYFQKLETAARERQA